MSELKSCAQCGFAAEIYQDIDKSYCISCSNGNCSTRPLLRRVDLQEAIDAWNTRADVWINIEEQLPKIGQECLIEIPVCERFNVESGKYKGNGVWVGAWCSERGNGCHYKVSRWMTRL